MAKKQNNPKSNTGSDAPKAQPVEEVRIGSVKAAIWLKRHRDRAAPQRHPPADLPHRGRPVARPAGTTSFGPGDLLVLVKVDSVAHTRVMQLIGEQREQERDRQLLQEQSAA